VFKGVMAVEMIRIKIQDVAVAQTVVVKGDKVLWIRKKSY